MAILIVYWTGTGNTEIMAEAMYQGIVSNNVAVDLKTVDKVTEDDIDKYDKIMFGCPSMGIEALEEDEFEPFFLAIEPKLANKKIALFGSYGWGEGEWMDDWEKRVNALGCQLFEAGLKINSTPSSDEVILCKEFGIRFSTF